MSDIEVLAFEGLEGTPAAALALRGQLELHDKGINFGTLSVSDDQNAFVAFARNGRDMLPVGVMTWETGASGRTICINVVFVLPEFRGRGCYSAMWSSMVLKAGQIGASSITMETHVRNGPMRAIAARQGFFDETILLKFDFMR